MLVGRNKAADNGSVATYRIRAPAGLIQGG
jgi:hypothetical protein